jgi:hypothetical protein
VGHPQTLGRDSSLHPLWGDTVPMLDISPLDPPHSWGRLRRLWDTPNPGSILLHLQQIVQNLLVISHETYNDWLRVGTNY